VIFSGTNTYSGNTIISNGMVALLDGTTSLTNSPTVLIASGATLDLNARSNSSPAKTITVINGQTLNDSGTVNGTVIVNSGGVLTGTGLITSNFTISASGFLQPGGTNGIGRINVGLSPTLSGRTIIEIDKGNSATNDQVFAGGPVIYGGTLTVTNIGPALASGDAFKVFNGSSYPTFFTLDLPNPGAGLLWNTNGLNTNGTLYVVSAVTGPTTNATITSVTRSGTNLLVHGTNNNVPNTSFHYVVLTTPNITNALSNWTPVITNPFNPDGTFDYTNPIVPGTPQQFINVKAVP
jgi:autotransporter-associated beta strand protein